MGVKLGGILHGRELEIEVQVPKLLGNQHLTFKEERKGKLKVIFFIKKNNYI